MNNNLTIKNIEAITYISSESCNLNCSYCKIAKITSDKHKKEAENVRKSFENGSYTENIKNILLKYNQPLENIKQFAFWGQEPTTTLDAVTKDFPHMFQTFPNLEKTFFSTNGVAFYDRIIDYVKTIDETVDHDFRIELQFSYDGQYSNEQLRGISTNKLIETNLTKLFIELSQLDLKHVKIFGLFHNVISLELIKTLYDTNNPLESIQNFWDTIRAFIDKCYNIVKENKNIDLLRETTPGLINPYNATKEEGQLLTQFCQDSLQLGYNEILIMYNQIGDYFISKYNNYEDITKDVFKILLPYQTDIDDSYSSGCNVIEGNLNIRYTGEILNCQNLAFTLDSKELQALDNNDISIDIKLNLLKHSSSYPNLLTSSSKDINKYFWYWDNQHAKYFVPYQLVLTINLIYLLAQANQIPKSYLNDKAKIIRHAYFIINSFACWENNLCDTGSVFGRIAGQVRLIANGFCDCVDEFIQLNIKKE